MSRDSSLVYSSDRGRTCPDCERPVAECACASAPAAARAGAVRVRRETKGRRGKVVTVIEGLDLGPVALGRLARELKQACGSGGTVGDGTIEIQGDQVAKLESVLRDRGLLPPGGVSGRRR